MTTVNDVAAMPITAAAEWTTRLDAIRNLAARNVHWLLRGTLASVFIYHGLFKFTRLDAMSKMLGLPIVVVALVALAELGGGAFVVLGGLRRDGFVADLLTRLGGLMIVPVMIGAIVMVHWGQWSFVPSASHPMGGMQFQVALLLLSLFFVFKGNKA